MAFKSIQAVTAAALLLVTSMASSQNLYRYEDDGGRMVWGTMVPSHLVSKGYRIFDKNGRFLSEVERTLTLSQESQRAEELATEAREAELRERERQLDNRLMRRYSSVQDFEARHQLALGSLNDRRKAVKLKVDEVSAQMELITYELRKARRHEEKPPAHQVSQQVNLDVMRLRLTQELAQIDEEIRQYKQQSDIELSRLKLLMAD